MLDRRVQKIQSHATLVSTQNLMTRWLSQPQGPCHMTWESLARHRLLPPESEIGGRWLALRSKCATTDCRSVWSAHFAEVLHPISSTTQRDLSLTPYIPIFKHIPGRPKTLWYASLRSHCSGIVDAVPAAPIVGRIVFRHRHSTQVDLYCRIPMQGTISSKQKCTSSLRGWLQSLSSCIVVIVVCDFQRLLTTSCGKHEVSFQQSLRHHLRFNVLHRHARLVAVRIRECGCDLFVPLLGSSDRANHDIQSFLQLSVPICFRADWVNSDVDWFDCCVDTLALSDIAVCIVAVLRINHRAHAWILVSKHHKRSARTSQHIHVMLWWLLQCLVSSAVRLKSVRNCPQPKHMSQDFCMSWISVSFDERFRLTVVWWRFTYYGSVPERCSVTSRNSLDPIVPRCFVTLFAFVTSKNYQCFARVCQKYEVVSITHIMWDDLWYDELSAAVEHQQERCANTELSTASRWAERWSLTLWW